MIEGSKSYTSEQLLGKVKIPEDILKDSTNELKNLKQHVEVSSARPKNINELKQKYSQEIYKDFLDSFPTDPMVEPQWFQNLFNDYGQNHKIFFNDACYALIGNSGVFFSGSLIYYLVNQQTLPLEKDVLDTLFQSLFDNEKDGWSIFLTGNVEEIEPGKYSSQIFPACIDPNTQKRYLDMFFKKIDGKISKKNGNADLLWAAVPYMRKLYKDDKRVKDLLYIGARTFGGESMQEKEVPMMIEYLQTPGVSECIDYCIDHKSVKLQFGKKTLELDPLVHINVILGIVHQPGFSKDDITAASFENYEKTVNQFLGEHAGENPNNINIISINASNATEYIDERGRKRKEDHNNSFQNSDELIKQRESRGYTIIDLSSDSDRTAGKSKQEVLDMISQIIKEQPDKTHVIDIGLHGSTDGSSKYVLGDITKEDFVNIYQLGVNRNVILNIRSCFSYYKSDKEKNPNMITTYSSSKQPSNKGFTDVHIASYSDNAGNFNEDKATSLAESILYRSIHYNDSITPTYVRIGGKVRRI